MADIIDGKLWWAGSWYGPMTGSVAHGLADLHMAPETSTPYEATQLLAVEFHQESVPAPLTEAGKRLRGRKDV